MCTILSLIGQNLAMIILPHVPPPPGSGGIVKFLVVLRNFTIPGFLGELRGRGYSLSVGGALGSVVSGGCIGKEEVNGDEGAANPIDGRWRAAETEGKQVFKER